MNDSGPDDGSLLREWLSRGSEDSFRTLVERYAGLVHQVARRLTNDDSLAREASQGTFILLARRAKFLTGSASIGGWLHVVTVDQSRNLLRTQMRESRKRQQWREEALAVEENTGPAESTRQELDLALAGLAAGDREALLLRYYRALSVREVAAALGLNVDATQKRITRAAERLRIRLSARGIALPAVAVAAALTGLATDAKAGVSLASGLSSNALANVTAFTAPLSFLTTLLIVMTKKTAIITTATILILATSSYLLLHKSPAPAAAEHSSTSVIGRKDSGGSGPDDAVPGTTRRSRSAAMPDLEKRYGESRTRLAAHVGGKFLKILDGIAAMADLEGAYDEGMNISEAELGPLKDSLNLSQEQQTAAEKIFQEDSYNQRKKMKTLAENLQRDPSALTESILASDAYARNEIDKADYDAATQGVLGIMQSTHAGETAIPRLGSSASGKQTRSLDRPEVREKMRGILSPEQIQILADSEQTTDANRAPATSPALSNILPLATLEEMDQSMTSYGKMIDGVTTVLEAEKQMEEKQNGGK